MIESSPENDRSHLYREAVRVHDTDAHGILLPDNAEDFGGVGRLAHKWPKEGRVLVVAHVDDLKASLNRAAVAWRLALQNSQAQAFVVSRSAAQNATRA